MSQPDFGLDGLAEFSPSDHVSIPSRKLEPDKRRELMRAGEELGFRRREPDKVTRVKRAILGPTTPLYLRLEADVFNRFVRLSQDARLGRADFIGALMDAYEAAKPR